MKLELTEPIRTFFKSMTIPMAIYQKIDGKITAVMVTQGLCNMMHADNDKLLDILNNHLLERVHPDDMARLSRNISEFSRHLCGYDVIYRSKYETNDDYHYIHSIGKFMPDIDGRETALFTYADVSESESESHLLIESYKMFQNDHFYSDPVTGLPNLNYLFEFKNDILEKVKAYSKSPALFYFDVNGLRFYNNQYGFSQGDELLRLITNVLKSEFPKAFLNRGADDHFVMITDMTDDKQVSDKLKTINEKIKAGAFGNTAGVQAGICFLENNMELSTAMDHAKHSLREIRNDLNITHVYHTQENDEKYWEQRYILETFNQALNEKWIKVYYQAIMRVETGKAVALEALARWVDPLRGIIMPGIFIPVLEKYHMLYKLDLYMVEQICQEIPKRKEIGLPIIPVTVNFSAQDFDHADIVKSLNDIFEKYNADKNNIIIEITEQDLAKATDVFKSQLDSLRENGFHIWIDDFGSGYSSLNIFSQYNVDLIKFDLEFLRHLDDNNGANRHILKGMVDICNKLGIRTLAEGIESSENLEFLRKIGCNFAQGYYFYKPESLGSISFKIQNGNPIIECETPEERKIFMQEWKKTYGK